MAIRGLGGVFVYFGRIHRMILIELAKVFTLSLIGFTGLILLAGVISEAMKNGLGPAQILIARRRPTCCCRTPCRRPPLFATCIVHGRLSDNDSQPKAAELHVAHVVWPAALFGLFASAATMGAEFDVIPCTRFLYSELGSDAEELLYTMLKRRLPSSPNHLPNSREQHPGARARRRLLRYSAKGGACDLIACAKEAVLRVDFETRQLLVDLKHCEIVDGNVIGYVEERTLPVEMPLEWGGAMPKVRSTEMTWAELGFFHAKFSSEKAVLDPKSPSTKASSIAAKASRTSRNTFAI